MPVLYTRSLEIEQRLAELLGLIRKGEGSADELAEKLGVSTATIARGIAALRHRGNEITAVRRGTRWRYVTSRKKQGGS
jgi:biotin operon repressor